MATSGFPSVLKSPMTVDHPNGLAALPRRYGAEPDCVGAYGEAAGTRSWPEAGSARDVADASTTRRAQSHPQAERAARRMTPRSVGRKTPVMCRDAISPLLQVLRCPGT